MSSRKTVLVIEDEELVRTYLVHLLEHANWSTFSAPNGDAGLSLLSQRVFDVVVCDLDLGRGRDGFDVLRQRDSLNRATPFVMLTGHGTVARCREAWFLGASDFLEKPASPEHFLLSVDRALGVLTSCNELSPSSTEQVGRDSSADGHVRLAIRTIDLHFSDPEFSVAELARVCGVTREHLARLFRAHLGRTPLEQIHTRRIRAAERLLSNARLTIFDVASDCGYRTTTDFGIWFRKFNGVTPSEWRTNSRR